MTVKDLLAKHKQEFENLVSFFKNDIASIRTGRATPALVDDIEVEYYGQRLKVKELASISAPEPKSLLIQPWDKAAVEPISGAIRKSDVGIQPIVDGNAIRLNIPSLTEERRREFIKVLKQKTEETKIKVRRHREDIWSHIQKMEKSGEIREDDKFKGKGDLQKIVDEYNKKLEDLEKKKEQELLS